MLLRNNTILLEFMMTYTQNGPRCDRKETKRCLSSQISSIPCAPRWVSNILNDIWCSCIMMVYIDTSKLKWSFWTSHPWAGLPICHQNRAEAQTKDTTIWAWEPLTEKARKGWPQPVEQRTKKRWTTS
jgi:hypothetical protein